jgi:hypothetical protein
MIGVRRSGEQPTREGGARAHKREVGQLARWLTAGNLLISVLLLREELQMKRTGGPGIIALELAGNPMHVEQILGRWGEHGIAAARRSLLLDYGMLATYSPLMAMRCAKAGERFRRRGQIGLARLGAPLACGQLLAGTCDAVENAALLAVLRGRRGALPKVARASAIAKFALLGLGGSYALAARLVPRTLTEQR